MQGFDGLLRDLALVLCSAAVVTVVFQRLRLPVILGYLLAGVLIGPHVHILPAVGEERVETLADLGVILLMFSLGLGFTLEKLAKVAPTGGVVATVEMGLTFIAGFIVARLAGLGALGAVFVGVTVGITSTMFVAKTLAEIRVPTEVQGRVYGTIVFEDLVTIALLAVLTALAAGRQVSAGELGSIAGRLGLFLAILLVAGLLLVPSAARAVARLRRAETTTVAAAGFAFALAILAQGAGFSVALGAFLAGSLVAESGAGRIVEEVIRPLRDVFAAIFFVANGMLVDPAALIGQLPFVLVLVAVVLACKTVGGTVGSVLIGASIRSSVQTGLALAQIGEFSFIVAALAVASGTVPPDFQAMIVAVAVVLAAVTPLLVRRSDIIARWVDRRLPKPLQTWAGLYGSWLEGLRGQRTAGRRPMAREARVILIDAAVLAGIVIAVALSHGWVVTALMHGLGVGSRPASAVVVLLVAAATFPFLLGVFSNARRLARRLADEALAPRTAGPDTARAPRTALRRTLEVLIVVLLAAALVAVTLPFVPFYGGLAVLLVVFVTGLIAIWRSAADLRGHVRATAEVVAEALSRQRSGAGSETMEFVRLTLPGIGTPTSCVVPDGSPAVGRSLKELNLRGRTGATVVALVRGEVRIPFPDAEARLAAGDLLALAGTKNSIEAAREVVQTTG